MVFWFWGILCNKAPLVWYASEGIGDCGGYTLTGICPPGFYLQYGLFRSKQSRIIPVFPIRINGNIYDGTGGSLHTGGGVRTAAGNCVCMRYC